MFFIRLVKSKVLMLMAVLTLLGGCKEVLYSDLTEADANEMMALLVLSGIPASREKTATAGYSLLVDEDELAFAVTVLKNSGLPREQFVNFGDMFGDVGVVGTPFEERVRYAYATNQELSRTISQIKGVDSARVHVVIPPQERFGKSTGTARASIVIFHDRSFEPSNYSSRIKALVSFAVPELEIENISSNFFLSPGFVVNQTTTRIPNPNPAGSAMAADGTGTSIQGDSNWNVGVTLVGIGLFLILMIAVRLLVLGWRNLRRPRAMKRA